MQASISRLGLRSLLSLTFGYAFDLKLDDVVLPETLEHLTLDRLMTPISCFQETSMSCR